MPYKDYVNKKLFLSAEIIEERSCENSEYEEITLCEGVKIIKHFAFHHCKSLKRITLPDTLEEIHNFAFRDCPLLTYVKLPDNLTLVERHALTESTLNCGFYVSINRDSPLALLLETRCESVSGLFHLRDKHRVIYL